MTSPYLPHQQRPEGSGTPYPPAGGDAGPGSEPDQVAAVYGRGSTPAPSAGRRVGRRPPEAWAGAIFLTLAALPPAVVGAVLGLQPGNVNANLRARIDAAKTTVSTDVLISAFRAAGVTILVLALMFALFAWLAVAPKRGARAVVTALAGFEVVMLVAGIVIAGVDAVSVGTVLLAAAGTVLLYLPRTNEFLAGR